MTKNILHFSALYIILVIAQAVVFNNICLFDYAIPVIFIYLLIKLPISTNPNWVMTIGFSLGLIIDIFSNTLGYNALSCTVIAFLRKGIIRLYCPKDEEISDLQSITIKTIGGWPFFKYALTFVLIYCTLLFVIEAFTFLYPVRLIFRIVASTLLSCALILGIDSLTIRKREKRL